MRHSLETTYQIWDDKTGERLDIGPDRDSLGHTEVRFVTSDGKITSRISISSEQLPLLIEALQRVR